MKHTYSIEEILSAVDEIQNLKKNKKTLFRKGKDKNKDFSSVPKNTLKLIEEAEKNIN